MELALGVAALVQAASADSPALLRQLGSVPASAVRLPAAPESAYERLREANAGQRNKAWQTGFARELDATARAALAGDVLSWSPLARGGMLAHFSVSSTGAEGLRLGMTFARLPDGVELRFAGSRDPSRVIGPVLSPALRDAAVYWTPLTDGESQTVEIFLPAGVTPQSLDFSVPTLSHLTATPRAREKQLGAAGWCNTDVVCKNNPSKAYLDAVSAVAKMSFIDRGNAYTCTGTLLNTTPATHVPYFFTAGHCIGTQAEASTLETFWFYTAATCDGWTVNNMKQLSGGATLLATDEALDTTLLSLRAPPPAGVAFSGWDASRVTLGENFTALHHPRGDVMKISLGHTTRIMSDRVEVAWDSGVVEPGSSGSGLFTLSGGKYLLRGGLNGGTSSCGFPQGRDEYTRLDLFFPQIQQYLKPVDALVAIEFFHAGFGHYFVTASAEEIAAIDGGTFQGWVRTGESFKVSALDAAGAAKVCRFFSAAFSPKSSHFYTPAAAECASVKSNANWQYEGQVFSLTPATAAGVCPAATQPLFRLYNTGQGGAPNHRYTIRSDLRSRMLAQGWVSEGYGTLGVIGCVPN